MLAVHQDMAVIMEELALEDSVSSLCISQKAPPVLSFTTGRVLETLLTAPPVNTNVDIMAGCKVSTVGT